MFTDAQVALVLSAIDLGAPKPVLSSRTGLSPSELNDLLNELRDKKLIDDSNPDSVVLTNKGKLQRDRLVHSGSTGATFPFSVEASAEKIRAVDEKLDQLISGLKA